MQADASRTKDIAMDVKDTVVDVASSAKEAIENRVRVVSPTFSFDLK